MPKYAIDCEIVEIYKTKMLARVTIVDERGEVVLDDFVKPTPQIYSRNCISGVDKSKHLDALDIKVVKDKVADIIAGNILIGHTLNLTLRALDLSHPQSDQKDLAKYPPMMCGGHSVSLKTLAARHLGRSIQNGVYDSKENAQACMDLYIKFDQMWGF